MTRRLLRVSPTLFSRLQRFHHRLLISSATALRAEVEALGYLVTMTKTELPFVEPMPLLCSSPLSADERCEDYVRFLSKEFVERASRSVSSNGSSTMSLSPRVNVNKDKYALLPSKSSRFDIPLPNSRWVSPAFVRPLRLLKKKLDGLAKKNITDPMVHANTVGEFGESACKPLLAKGPRNSLTSTYTVDPSFDRLTASNRTFIFRSDQSQRDIGSGLFSIHNNSISTPPRATLDLAILGAGFVSGRTVETSSLKTERQKVVDALLALKGVDTVKVKRGFLRVSYNPKAIGARFILSELEKWHFRTKHPLSVHLRPPWTATCTTRELTNLIRMQRLLAIVRKKVYIYTVTFIACCLMSVIRLFLMTAQGSEEVHPIVKILDARFQIGIAVLAAVYAERRAFGLRFVEWKTGFGAAARCALFWSLLISTTIQLLNYASFRLAENTSVPPTAPSLVPATLLTFSLLYGARYLMVKTSFAALSTSVYHMRRKEAGSSLRSVPEGDKYRVVLKPEALDFLGSQPDQPAFFLLYPHQFERGIGPWCNQILLEPSSAAQPTGANPVRTGSPGLKTYDGDTLGPNRAFDSSISKPKDTGPIVIEVHKQLLQIGDVVIVEKGQQVPADGVALEQRTSDLSRPGRLVISNKLLAEGSTSTAVLFLNAGDIVPAGETNLGTPLVIKILRVDGGTAAAQLRNLLKVTRHVMQLQCDQNQLTQGHFRFTKLESPLRFLLVTTVIFAFVSGLLPLISNTFFNTRFAFLPLLGNPETPAHPGLNGLLTILTVVQRSSICVGFISASFGVALPIRYFTVACHSREIIVKDPLRTMPRLAEVDNVVLETSGLLSEGCLSVRGAALIPDALAKANMQGILRDKTFFSAKARPKLPVLKNAKSETGRLCDKGFFFGSPRPKRSSLPTSTLRDGTVFFKSSPCQTFTSGRPSASRTKRSWSVETNVNSQKSDETHDNPPARDVIIAVAPETDLPLTDLQGIRSSGAKTSPCLPPASGTGRQSDLMRTQSSKTSGDKNTNRSDKPSTHGSTKRLSAGPTSSEKRKTTQLPPNTLELLLEEQIRDEQAQQATYVQLLQSLTLQHSEPGSSSSLAVTKDLEMGLSSGNDSDVFEEDGIDNQKSGNYMKRDFGHPRSPGPPLAYRSRLRRPTGGVFPSLAIQDNAAARRRGKMPTLAPVTEADLPSGIRPQQIQQSTMAPNKTPRRLKPVKRVSHEEMTKEFETKGSQSSMRGNKEGLEILWINSDSSTELGNLDGMLRLSQSPAATSAGLLDAPSGSSNSCLSSSDAGARVRSMRKWPRGDVLIPRRDALNMFWWTLWSIYSSHPNGVSPSLDRFLNGNAELLPPQPSDEIHVCLDGEILYTVAGLTVGLSTITGAAQGTQLTKDPGDETSDASRDASDDNSSEDSIASYDVPKPRLVASRSYAADGKPAKLVGVPFLVGSSKIRLSETVEEPKSPRVEGELVESGYGFFTKWNPTPDASDSIGSPNNSISRGPSQRKSSDFSQRSVRRYASSETGGSTTEKPHLFDFELKYRINSSPREEAVSQDTYTRSSLLVSPVNEKRPPILRTAAYLDGIKIATYDFDAQRAQPKKHRRRSRRGRQRREIHHELPLKHHLRGRRRCGLSHDATLEKLLVNSVDSNDVGSTESDPGTRRGLLGPSLDRPNRSLDSHPLASSRFDPARFSYSEMTSGAGTPAQQELAFENVEGNGSFRAFVPPLLCPTTSSLESCGEVSLVSPPLTDRPEFYGIPLPPKVADEGLIRELRAAQSENDYGVEVTSELRTQNAARWRSQEESLKLLDSRPISMSHGSRSGSRSGSNMTDGATTPLQPHRVTARRRRKTATGALYKQWRTDEVELVDERNLPEEAFLNNSIPAVISLHCPETRVRTPEARSTRSPASIIDVFLANGAISGGAPIAQVLKWLKLTPKQMSDAQCSCEPPCPCRSGPQFGANGLALGASGLPLAVAVNTPHLNQLKLWDRRHQLAGHSTVILHVNGVCIGKTARQSSAPMYFFFKGGVAFADTVRSGARNFVHAFHVMGYDIWLCSIEDFVVAQGAAEAVGIAPSRVVCRSMPKDRLDLILRLQRGSKFVCFIGSGSSHLGASPGITASVGRPQPYIFILCDGMKDDGGVINQSSLTAADFAAADVVVGHSCDARAAERFHLKDLEWLFRSAKAATAAAETNLVVALSIATMAIILGTLLGMRWPALKTDLAWTLIYGTAAFISIVSAASQSLNEHSPNRHQIRRRCRFATN